MSKRNIVIIVVVLVVLALVTWWFVRRGQVQVPTTPPEEPTLQEVTPSETTPVPGSEVQP